MTCSVSVDMSGILEKMDTMNTRLGEVVIALCALSGATTATAVATLIADVETPLQKLGTAIIGAVLQANTTGDPADLITALNAIANRIAKSTDTDSLADRINTDLTPSLGQRVLNWGIDDGDFPDVGSVADRLGPVATDEQCIATDEAWADSPGTQNVAEALYDLGFVGCPVPGGLP